MKGLFCFIFLGGIAFTLSHIIYVPPLEGQEWIASLAWGLGIPFGIALSAMLVLYVYQGDMKRDVSGE